MYVLTLLIQQAYDQTAVWKRYMDRLQSAHAVEVQWTKREVPASTIFHGQSAPRTRTFKLLFRKPDYILLEEDSISRVVWNGKQDIELDLVKKTWKSRTEKSAFEEAQFLGLLGVPPEIKDSKLTGKVSAYEDKGVRWTTLSVNTYHVDAGSQFDFTFSDRTGLLALLRVEHRGMLPWKGKLEYRIQVFDPDQMLLTTDFPIQPPKGFTEASSVQAR